MDRIRELNGYQKGLLIILTVILVIFSIVYPIVTAREGYAYQGKLFLPGSVGNTTTYSAKLNGEQAVFTVAGDTVTLRWGERLYGPYTVTEDPAVVPTDHTFTQGFVVREGTEIIFQGGVYWGDWMTLFNQDGSLYGIDSIMETSDSEEEMEPPVSSLIELVAGPELTKQGTWAGFAGGVFITILTIVEILFADEIFRFRIFFKVADPDHAEPSDWEIAGRYIGWTAMTLIAAAGYLSGLFQL